VNVFLPKRYQETIQRLALGLEPIDAVTRHRVRHVVNAALEHVPQPVDTWRNLQPGDDVNDYLPRLDRHPSCHYVLLYQPGLKQPVDLRLFDSARRFVPRRLSVPISTEAAVVAADDPTKPQVPLSSRVLRPYLFPGAAYDVSESATGLRGRAVRGGIPMRWARIEARLVATNELLGRAHGDDRGDFLLLVQLDPAHVGDPGDPLVVQLTLLGPSVPPVPAYALQPVVDPYWDLPLEKPSIPPPGSDDPAAAGNTPPPGYVPSAGGPTNVSLPLGRISSAGIPPLTFS
jgi:hypothetical protein